MMFPPSSLFFFFSPADVAVAFHTPHKKTYVTYLQISQWPFLWSGVHRVKREAEEGEPPLFESLLPLNAVEAEEAGEAEAGVLPWSTLAGTAEAGTAEAANAGEAAKAVEAGEDGEAGEDVENGEEEKSGEAGVLP
jgi:hypothetical protein